MRWIAHFILAYFAVGLQIGLSPYVRYHGAPPNLVLLAVVFISVNAPRDAALLGAFSLGLMQDLVTQDTMGVYALAYGLVAMFIVSTQELVYKSHPLTHISLTFLGGLMTAAVLLVHGLVRPPGSGVRFPISQLLLTVIYTTMLSPFLLGALQRFHKTFGFQSARRNLRMR